MADTTQQGTQASIIETQQERTDLPLVIVPAIYPDMLDAFQAVLPLFHDVARVRLHTDPVDGDAFVERAEGADALIVINVHIPDDMLRTLSSHVRVLAFGGTGVASYVNLDLARQLGVRICNIRHYGNAAVAEFAIALMLELARHAGELNEQVLGGGWEGASGIELDGKTLAIVGLGGIGQHVARIANAFGMKVTAWDSGRHDAQYYADLGVTPVADMRALFAGADVISLHMPLNDDTRGMITADELAAIRPGTLFVNTARAEVIAPGALVDRLAQGDVPAGLDVFYHEPLPLDSPLRTMPSVILAPHVGWRTDGSNRNLTKQCAQAVVSYFQGGDYNVVVDGAATTADK